MPRWKPRGPHAWPDRIPIDVVKRWYDIVEASLPEDCRGPGNIATLVGVELRTLYNIRHQQRSDVPFDVAERIARAAECSDEFVALLPPLEDPNWAPGGRWGTGPKYTHCQRCGTTDRRHRANGLCTACYASGWYRTNVSGKETTWMGWSTYHHSCVWCHRTDRKHSAYGLCRGCYYKAYQVSRQLGIHVRNFTRLGLHKKLTPPKGRNRKPALYKA